MPTHDDEAVMNGPRVRQRMEELDRLDALGDGMEGRVRELEGANATLYAQIRSEIRRGVWPELFVEAMAGDLPRGVGYDWLDDLVSGVLQLQAPEGEEERVAERVFYQPTPARHILAFARMVHAEDVVVDLGSGLGHVPMLVSACTGARCVGVEVEPGLVASARRCAEGLKLSRVSFAEWDALEADLSGGTVFYLYTPFTGSILRGVLDRLRDEARGRRLRVCTFGPCTEVVGREDWLEARGELGADRVVEFRAREAAFT